MAAEPVGFRHWQDVGFSFWRIQTSKDGSHQPIFDHIANSKNSSIDLPLKDRGDHPGISGMDTCLFPDYRIITFWFLAPKCCFFRLILSTSLSETLLKKAHLPTLSLQIFDQSFVQRHLTCHEGSSSTYQNPILAIMWMLRMRFFSLAATLSLPLYV